MKYIFVTIIVITIIVIAVSGIAVLTWSFRKRAKLDFLHFPDRRIDMCARCNHEYQSDLLQNDLQNLERAARMNMTLPEDFWNRFCCDALREKLRVKYAEASLDSFSQMLARSGINPEEIHHIKQEYQKFEQEHRKFLGQDKNRR